MFETKFNMLPVQYPFLWPYGHYFGENLAECVYVCGSADICATQAGRLICRQILKGSVSSIAVSGVRSRLEGNTTANYGTARVLQGVGTYHNTGPLQQGLRTTLMREG